MNLETERLNNGMQYIHEAIDKRILTDSQEYYALAVLKSLFPFEYKDLTKKEKDRPDLKTITDDFGVEVTTADHENDNDDNRLLSLYRLNKKEGIIKKVKRHRKELIEKDGLIILSGGGGHDNRYDGKLLIKSIQEKIKSAQKYISEYPNLELVVIKNERVPGDWEENISHYVKTALEHQDCMFRKIYVLYQETCYCFSKNGDYKKVHIANMTKMRLLARLTAEGVIHIKDYEWL